MQIGKRADQICGALHHIAKFSAESSASQMASKTRIHMASSGPCDLMKARECSPQSK